MLRSTIKGEKNRPVLLFLHGFMGSRSDWEPVVDELSATCCCLTVDLPGHGESKGLPESLYTFEGVRGALVEVLDFHGIDRCVFIGYSMGARLALDFVCRHPERCAGLVLESGTPGITDPDERSTRLLVDEERARMLETTPMGDFVRSWYEQPLFLSLADRPEIKRELLEHRSRNNAGELVRALRGFSVGHQPSLWDRLPVLPFPILAIAGAYDGKYVEIARQMAVLSDSIRVITVPHAGHVVHLETPSVLPAAIRELLALTV